MNFDLVIPSLEYKDDIMNFLSEVKKVDACKPWQYAGMASLEASHSYNDWVVEKANQEKGLDLPSGYVPASTYLLVRKVDKKVIGMVNIRHELSEFLLNFGGHIGQSIRPSERGKGYGTKQLMLALEKCAKMGIENVLVTCNIENVASAKTIEKCYGELENIVKNGDEILKRYWIDVNKIKTLTK